MAVVRFKRFEEMSVSEKPSVSNASCPSLPVPAISITLFSEEKVKSPLLAKTVIRPLPNASLNCVFSSSATSVRSVYSVSEKVMVLVVPSSVTFMDLPASSSRLPVSAVKDREGLTLDELVILAPVARLFISLI
ncbi:hypothetical protein SDC9_125346 [bioreactor metagenome]|uniref:Uncharacterized protein n=1 Tax=bioreactor metagenome TaxID=1076179 RepID=A0A645CN58_9ZZZZ